MSSYGGLHPDGFLGSTEYGGTSGYGTVFHLTDSFTGGVWTETVVGSFTGADGSYPYSSPEGGYGTTNTGGVHNGGTVYSATDTGILGTVYNFCSAPNCSDGANPLGQTLVLGTFVFGTTEGGGAEGEGTIFKLESSTGAYTVVHSFDFAAGDGAFPTGSLAVNQAVTLLYGTTSEGGPPDEGTVFELNLSSGALTILHSFTGSPSGDGVRPVGGVILDSAGNLYGTTSQGGKFGKGTVYEISAAGKETVLYSFTGGADGSAPEGALAQDPAGNLVGTTTSGGVGYGTVFELTPNGTLGVLHTFCVVAGCPDGATPTGSMYRGNTTFYGTTTSGGAYGKGVVFQLVE